MPREPEVESEAPPPSVESQQSPVGKGEQSSATSPVEPPSPLEVPPAPLPEERLPAAPAQVMLPLFCVEPVPSHILSRWCNSSTLLSICLRATMVTMNTKMAKKQFNLKLINLKITSKTYLTFNPLVIP